MGNMLNVEPYRDTTAGEVAETLRRLGLEVRPSERHADAVVVAHEESGLELFLQSDEDMVMIPGTVAMYRLHVEEAEIANGAAFDAVLAEVKKRRAHS